jgi:hypothetical protein
LPISGMPTRSTKHAAISAWRMAQYQKADQAMNRASESMERAVCTQPMLIATYLRCTPWTAPILSVLLLVRTGDNRTILSILGHRGSSIPTSSQYRLGRRSCPQAKGLGRSSTSASSQTRLGSVRARSALLRPHPPARQRVRSSMRCCCPPSARASTVPRTTSKRWCTSAADYE